MKHQHDQPKNEGNRSGGQGDEHEPTHHTEGIKQLAIIFAINDARVDRAFINLAAVRAGDDTARHH